MKHYSAHRSRQQGLTLIEIMIALVLSLFVLGTILTLFISTKQSYREQAAFIRLQENGRFAVYTLGKLIRKTGYRADINNPLENVFPAAAEPFNVAGRVISGTDTTLSVRYQVDGDGWLQNCLGSGTAANVTETVSVSGGELKCTSNGVTQALLGNVQDIRFLYGEDTNADGFADRYARASQIASNWGKVVSAQVELLLVSEENNIVSSPRAYVFDANNDGISETVSVNDKRLYHVYKQVIALRNLIP